MSVFPFLQVITQGISLVGLLKIILMSYIISDEPYKVCRYLNTPFLRAFDVLKPNLIYVCPHHRRCLRRPTPQLCEAEGRTIRSRGLRPATGAMICQREGLQMIFLQEAGDALEPVARS